MRLLLYGSVLAVTLWGCAVPEASPGTSGNAPVTEPGESASVRLSPSRAPAARPLPRVRASLSVSEGLSAGESRLRIVDTPRLTVTAKVEHLAGTAQLSLLLVSPEGNAYSVGAWRVDGDGAAVERALTIPVRGTAIEDLSLTGDWTAQLSMNGHVVDALIVGME